MTLPSNTAMHLPSFFFFFTKIKNRDLKIHKEKLPFVDHVPNSFKLLFSTVWTLDSDGGVKGQELFLKLGRGRDMAISVLSPFCV